MKRLAIMCFALCFVSTIATAQKVTEKDLQGSWKMTALDTQGIHLDIEKKEVTIPEEIKSQLPPENIQQIETNMKQAAVSLNEAYMHIDDNNIRQVMGPQEEKGTFAVTDKDSKQFITTTFENGQSTETEVAMLDSNTLQITQTDGAQVANFMYKKQ